MKTRVSALVGVCFALIAGEAVAVDASVCEKVLVPSVERSTDDYSLLQSYMLLHSEEEYEKFKTMDSNQLGGSAAYKMFEAEYGQSTTKEEFRDKVLKRLKDEKFSMSQQEAKTRFRTSIPAYQSADWLKCIQALAGVPALLLTHERSLDPRERNEAFLVYMTFVAPTGVGIGTPVITTTGGTVLDKANAQKSIATGATRTFTFKPDNTSSNITISVNVSPATYGLTFSRKIDKVKLIMAGSEKRQPATNSARALCPVGYTLDKSDVLGSSGSPPTIDVVVSKVFTDTCRGSTDPCQGAEVVGTRKKSYANWATDEFGVTIQLLCRFKSGM